MSDNTRLERVVMKEMKAYLKHRHNADSEVLSMQTTTPVYMQPDWECRQAS